MSVFINFKICDNAQECSGVVVCQTKALVWDDAKESVIIENEKCISCEMCVNECPAGAIRVAHNDVEEREIKEDYENDPRTLKDLMVERYGASPVNENTLISVQEATLMIKKKSPLIVVEVIDGQNTPCLINSIPIAEIFGFKEYEYYKVTNEDKLYESFAHKYAIKDCPTLLVFLDGTILVRKDGSVENGDYIERMEFIKEINNALGN